MEVMADEHGLTVAWAHGRPHLTIGWDEVHAVIVSKVDVVSHEELVIDLEHENGDFLSLTGVAMGLEAAAEVMTRHLVGLEPGWLERARDGGATPRVVWRRSTAP
jgi:hypothetical protein